MFRQVVDRMPHIIKRHRWQIWSRAGSLCRQPRFHTQSARRRSDQRNQDCMETNFHTLLQFNNSSTRHTDWPTFNYNRRSDFVEYTLYGPVKDHLFGHNTKVQIKQKATLNACTQWQSSRTPNSNQAGQRANQKGRVVKRAMRMPSALDSKPLKESNVALTPFQPF